VWLSRILLHKQLQRSWSFSSNIFLVSSLTTSTRVQMHFKQWFWTVQFKSLYPSCWDKISRLCIKLVLRTLEQNLSEEKELKVFNASWTLIAWCRNSVWCSRLSVRVLWEPKSLGATVSISFLPEHGGVGNNGWLSGSATVEHLNTVCDLFIIHIILRTFAVAQAWNNVFCCIHLTIFMSVHQY